MRRLLAMVLVICMMVPFAVFAETTEVSTANISGTTYNIYIEGEASANNVSVMLRNEDATDVAYVAQLTPDKNNYGKYVTKFKFNGDIKNYGVYVRDDATGEDVSASVTTAIAENELYTATLNVASVNDAGNAYISEGDAIDISVDIKNKYGDNATMKVLVAAYGENNRLLDTKSTTVSALYEDLSATKDATTSFSVPAGTVKAKVFIWSDTETLIPVAPSKMLVNGDKVVTVHLAGDSLCQTYGSGSYPRDGWGTYLVDYLADGIDVNNQAVAGWSTSCFLWGKAKDKGAAYINYENSRWYNNILQKSQPGDYVIISFGINDLWQSSSNIYVLNDTRYVKSDGYYKPVDEYDDAAGTASLNTDETTWLKSIPSDTPCIYGLTSMLEDATEPSITHYRTFYKDNLRKMIDTARERDVEPILMSSTGHYGETSYGNVSNAGVQEYFTEMEEVAQEYAAKGEPVTFINLHDYTDEKFQELGEYKRVPTIHLDPVSYAWFEKYGDGTEVKEADAGMDAVHYNINGAKWVASCVAKLIYESDSSLAELVNEPDIYDVPILTTTPNE